MHISWLWVFVNGSNWPGSWKYYLLKMLPWNLHFNKPFSRLWGAHRDDSLRSSVQLGTGSISKGKKKGRLLPTGIMGEGFMEWTAFELRLQGWADFEQTEEETATEGGTGDGLGAKALGSSCRQRSEGTHHPRIILVLQRKGSWQSLDDVARWCIGVKEGQIEREAYFKSQCPKAVVFNGGNIVLFEGILETCGSNYG